MNLTSKTMTRLPIPFSRRTLAVLLRGTVLFSILALPGFAQAEDPEAGVQGVIDQLFDGMRAGDSTAVRTAFTPDARMLTVTQDQEGNPVLREGSLDRFVTAVGTPHDDVWDERLSDVEIRIDGRMATAWTPYAFHLGDRVSHCGVNAFQLFNSPDGWRIINITDTRRACE